MWMTRLILAMVALSCKCATASPIQNEFQHLLFENAAYYAQLCERCNALSLRTCADGVALEGVEGSRTYNMTLYCLAWSQQQRNGAQHGIVQRQSPSPTCHVVLRKTSEPSADDDVVCLMPAPHGDRIQRAAAPDEEDKVEPSQLDAATEMATAEAATEEAPITEVQAVVQESITQTPADESIASVELLITAEPETEAQAEPMGANADGVEAMEATTANETAAMDAQVDGVATLDEHTNTSSFDYQADMPLPSGATDAPALGSDAMANGGAGPTAGPPLAGPSAHSCYTCSSGSSGDATCRTQPTKLVKCPAPPEASARNGCFTLLKVATNTTERGCLADLTAEGRQFCQRKAKLCQLCHETMCNHLPVAAMAPSGHGDAAAVHQLLPLALLVLICGRSNWFN